MLEYDMLMGNLQMRKHRGASLCEKVHGSTPIDVFYHTKLVTVKATFVIVYFMQILVLFPIAKL